MGNVKFGWKAGTEQYGPQDLLQYAVGAEQAGFDSIEASDHFHPWAEKGQACFVWTWLGAVAARTKRIRLGTGVTCPIFRCHPAIIAQAAATLDCLAPGRTFLGVGTGEALNEYPVTVEWPEYKIRRERLAEAIELMRKLWSGEKVGRPGSAGVPGSLWQRSVTTPPARAAGFSRAFFRRVIGQSGTAERILGRS
jgi:coenzyme F420-dependent glucose-6-phosphate dehydrogenase